MRYEVVRSEKEIDDLLNCVVEQVEKGESRFRGETFEAGIQYGIEWLIGLTDDHPYE